MRKVILSLLFSGIGIYAMGQGLVIAPHHNMPLAPGALKVAPKAHLIGAAASATAASTSSGTNNWYKNREDADESGSQDFSNWFHVTEFPDSTVKVVYGDGNGGTELGYANTEGYGEVFDPRSPIYDTAGNVLSLYNTYTVDSMTLPYMYNYVPEKDSASKDGLAHDTLIFQFYTVKTLGVDTGSFPSQTTPPPGFPGGPWAAVAYNYKTNLGVRSYTATAADTVVLDSTDSTGGNVGLLTIPVMANSHTVGIPVNSNNTKTGYNKDLFAYTVSYRPGFKYKLKDTIDESWTTPAPTNLHSHFQVLIGQDQDAVNSEKYPQEGREMSLTVTSSIRYNVPNGNFNGSYVPGTAWLAYNQILWSYFHIYSASDAAINQVPGDPQGFILGNVYPNPATGTAKLDFALGNTEQVKITLYDILGHEIATLADGQYTSGEHTISFNTDNLKEGVYLYSINAGSFSKTLKFTVAQN